jgi:hypothetical protein
MKDSKNWRYKLAVKYYDFFGIDVTKIISSEKRFQRAIDFSIILTITAILGAILSIYVSLLRY